MIKRSFDILTAGLGLIILSPLMALAAVLIKGSSAGPVLFKQERMGKDFHPFVILKFRTMVADAPLRGGQLTLGQDPRVTRIGRLLRKGKIDELPQLFNVLKGEMSVVGPRPEVGKYVLLFRQDYEEILRVRPGITDLASVKYRDEVKMLTRFDDIEEGYLRQILPDKIRLAKQYLKESSFVFDMNLIFRTILAVLTSKR
ncbi:MAG: sugar transferase [Candidatus Binatia bacterium]